MKSGIVLVLLLLPWSAFADKECRVVEFPDHIEAVCDGKTNNKPEQAENTELAVSDTSVTHGAQVSRKRRQLESVRSLNAHRFDAEETQLTPETGAKVK